MPIILDEAFAFYDDERLENILKYLNDEFKNIYKSRVKIEYPEIIKFIRLANKSNAKLSYTVDNKELLKDIYRSVK